MVLLGERIWDILYALTTVLSINSVVVDYSKRFSICRFRPLVRLFTCFCMVSNPVVPRKLRLSEKEISPSCAKAILETKDGLSS